MRLESRKEEHQLDHDPQPINDKILEWSLRQESRYNKESRHNQESRSSKKEHSQLFQQTSPMVVTSEG